jgi:hypothetical protein
MTLLAAEKTKMSTYKGKPLVRSGNVLYYGDPEQEYIAMLQILSQKDFMDMTVAEKVSVQILSTDETLHTSRRVLKRTEKVGLYNALLIASIWLERALASK